MQSAQKIDITLEIGAHIASKRGEHLQSSF